MNTSDRQAERLNDLRRHRRPKLAQKSRSSPGPDGSYSQQHGRNLPRPWRQENPKADLTGGAGVVLIDLGTNDFRDRKNEPTTGLDQRL